MQTLVSSCILFMKILGNTLLRFCKILIGFVWRSLCRFLVDSSSIQTTILVIYLNNFNQELLENIMMKNDIYPQPIHSTRLLCSLWCLRDYRFSSRLENRENESAKKKKKIQTDAVPDKDTVDQLKFSTYLKMRCK